MRGPNFHETRHAADSRDKTGAGATSPSDDEVGHARAREYSLLSTLLLRNPDAAMIERLARLRGDPTPLGTAHAALGRAAARVTVERAEREFFDLFVGLTNGGLFPYASYYLTGSLQGRPLARLREVLRSLGVQRAPGQSEPEDHAAILLAIMAGLADGRIAAPAGVDRAIFEEHLAPWIARFFADLEHTKLAEFYASVGALGRTFVEIELKAFALPA